METPSPLVINWWLWVGLFLYWLIAALFANRTKSSEPALLRLSHGLPLALAYYLIFNRHRFFFLLGEVYDTEWNNWIVYPGMALTAGGFAFLIWARIHLGRYWSGNVTLKEGHKVIKTGPYALVRHPIYTGWLFAIFGSALVAGTADGFLGFLIIILAFLVKLFREEKLLTNELGQEYRHYIDEVPAALIPFVSSVGGKSKPTIASEAFDQAALRSDTYRACGILCICAVFIMVGVISLLTDSSQTRLYMSGLTWWAALAVYEGILLTITIHAQWLRQPVDTWVWAVNAAIECALPSLGILGLTLDKGYLGPYRALVSSSLCIYYLFIILSTLRLRPLLSVISGAASSLGYLAVVLFTFTFYPHNTYRSFIPVRTYAFDITLLLGAGLLAAAVAHQIRRHLIAALAEVETRRKLDRMEFDVRTARTIQMGLLPKFPPRVEGYEIAGFSRPADQTGGDYYDWIPLSGNRVLFTIGDATGHGLGPSLLISTCRAYFRALAQRDDPPERIMTEVDLLLQADGQDGRFITAAVALLDAGANRLMLYSAGHAPLYLFVAATNAVAVYDADQPPLGVACENGNPAAREISLSSGDALILVTDGFFEYHSQTGEMFGSERLVEFIRQNHAMPPAELIRRLHEDVVHFSAGAPQMDDMTAVVIKRI